MLCCIETEIDEQLLTKSAEVTGVDLAAKMFVCSWILFYIMLCCSFTKDIIFVH